MRREKATHLIAYVYVLAFVVLLFSCALFAWFITQYLSARLPAEHAAESTASTTVSSKTEACVFRRAVDGACVERAEDMNPRFVGVMIENSADAWPLSGISRASVVYEAPAESNIPRFLALFPADAVVPMVGPVRSARPYYLDWLAEYGDSTPYMHVGGSPEALDRLASSDIIDLNEMTRGWYFWRARDRDAPHNAYTSSRLWQKAIDDYGSLHPVGTPPVSNFWSGTPCATSCVTRIHVVFSSPLYVANWKYNASTTRYDRYQVGEPFLDRDSSQVSADTVIVERVNVSVIDEVGRKHIETIGQGPLTVFHDGFAISGMWRKKSISAPTEWLDESGNPIPLKGGIRWIEVIPQNGVASSE